jgi:hypothetical protein
MPESMNESARSAGRIQSSSLTTATRSYEVAKRLRFLYRVRGCDNRGNDNVEPGHPDRCEQVPCGLGHGRARDAFATHAGAPAGPVRYMAASSAVLDVCVRIGRDRPRRGAPCFCCCSRVSRGRCDGFGRGSTDEQGGMACGASRTRCCLSWCLTRRHEDTDLRRTRAGFVVAGARWGPHSCRAVLGGGTASVATQSRHRMG